MCLQDYRRRVKLALSYGETFIVLSAVFFSVSRYFVKLAEQELSVWTILFARCIGVLCLVAAAAKYNQVKLVGNEPRQNGPLLVLHGGIRGVYILLELTALTFMPVGDYTVLCYTYPAVTAFLLRVYLREKYTLLDASGSLFSLMGIILVSQPTALGFSNQGDQHAVSLHGVLATVAVVLVEAHASIILRVCPRTLLSLQRSLMRIFTGDRRTRACARRNGTLSVKP